MDGITQSGISEIFDRAVVVNLARRPERFVRFETALTDWPFKTPQRFEAVDGNAIGIPAGWGKGPGAWGCLQSHLRIVDQAVADGVRALLVLEDDASPVLDFSALVFEFLKNVPDDWEGLMLGGEHLTPPLAVGPGLVRCVLSNRTHAYAARGRYLAMLAHFWRNTKNDHCDIVMASLMPHFKVYAPNPMLIGQDAGHSDVTGKLESVRFVSPVSGARSQAA